MTASTSRAYAVLTQCQQSHPFEDRRIPFEDEPIKIGRSVAKLRPSVENAIFDCKVLSRNHAIAWYDNGQFFLKDTKSSNGTFVNNQRLSKGSEESPAREIFSGDILQFGVEIIENTKKVTHGSIICIARLYLPDGREASSRSEIDISYSHASPSPSTIHSSAVSVASATINSQELYQLQQYIKEAVYREQLIESRLAALHSLLNSTQDASENCWRALIDEDRLLSRIELLEGQLMAYSKGAGEDRLREQIQQLHEEKERYELAGKENIRRALEEKLEAMQRLADVERSLETTEEECAHFRDAYASSHCEIDRLSQQHNSALQRNKQLAADLEALYTRAQAEKLDAESKLGPAETELSDAESKSGQPDVQQYNGEISTEEFANKRDEINRNQRAEEVREIESMDKELAALRNALLQAQEEKKAVEISAQKTKDELVALEEQFASYVSEIKSGKLSSAVQAATQPYDSRIFLSENHDSTQEEKEQQLLAESDRFDDSTLALEPFNNRNEIDRLSEQRDDALQRVKSLCEELDQARSKYSALEHRFAAEKLYLEQRLATITEQYNTETSTLLNKLEEARQKLADQAAGGFSTAENLARATDFDDDSQLQDPFPYSDYNDDDRSFVWEDVILQTRTITLFSCIPLILLFVALVLAFFPFLSRITATNED